MSCAKCAVPSALRRAVLLLGACAASHAVSADGLFTGAYSNYVAFAKSFMLHRNRHTGRTYAEEPALAWISLVNEGNQGLFGTAIYEKEPVYRKMWEAWLKAERKRSPEAFKDVTTQFPKNLFNDADPQARAFLKFLVAVERRSVNRRGGGLRRQDVAGWSMEVFAERRRGERRLCAA